MRNSPGLRPGSFCHSASVMNGTTGCRRRSAPSKTWSSTARATSRSLGSASAPSRPFTDSRYQSASSFHTNRRADSAYSLRRSPAYRSSARQCRPSASSAAFVGCNGPSAPSHSAIAPSKRSSTHKSGSAKRRRSMSTSGRTGASPRFDNRKRPMFHSLVAKFRPAENDFSRSAGSRITSAPIPSPAISVQRNASAP